MNNMTLAVITLVKPILTERITTLVTQTLKMWARMMLMMKMMLMQIMKIIPLMVTLMQTTVKIILLMVPLMQTFLVMTMPEANDTGIDNVEATDADIYDADSNAADDSDDDNYDVSRNAKYGVSNDIYENDDGTDIINPDIDYPDDTDAYHDPIFCLVWSSVALLK